MSASEPTADVGTTLLFENERLRVWELLLGPGETCAPHRHLHDHLIIYAEPATMRARLKGRPVLQHVEDGLVSYRAVGRDGLPPHQITNVTERPSRHFIVELLGPSVSDRAGEHEHNGRGRTEPIPE